MIAPKTREGQQEEVTKWLNNSPAPNSVDTPEEIWETFRCKNKWAEVTKAVFLAHCPAEEREHNDRHKDKVVFVQGFENSDGFKN